MTESTEENNPSGLLYSVRLLIRHPVLDVQAITDHLGIDPTYSWSVGDPGRSDTMWALETWTEGERSFFEELRDVLGWLEGIPDFINEVRAGKGEMTLIAQLAGRSNIGDELSPETMARASMLGVSIGVEIFPDLQRRQ